MVGSAHDAWTICCDGGTRNFGPHRRGKQLRKRGKSLKKLFHCKDKFDKPEPRAPRHGTEGGRKCGLVCDTIKGAMSWYFESFTNWAIKPTGSWSFFSGLLFPKLLKLSEYCDDLHLLKMYFSQYKYEFQIFKSKPEFFQACFFLNCLSWVHTAMIFICLKCFFRSTNMSFIYSYHRCKNVRHFERESECPAKGKTCYKCRRADHFCSQCSTKTAKPSKRGRRQRERKRRIRQSGMWEVKEMKMGMHILWVMLHHLRK